jgi:hypothetical protein
MVSQLVSWLQWSVRRGVKVEIPGEGPAGGGEALGDLGLPFKATSRSEVIMLTQLDRHVNTPLGFQQRTFSYQDTRCSSL